MRSRLPAAARGHRSPLHPLHLRHHRQTQRRGARQRRPRRRLGLVDEVPLRRRSRGGLLGGVGHGLGGRPLDIVYGPLLVGATTVIFEGKPVGTQTPGPSGGYVQDHRVKALFTAPMRSVLSGGRPGAELVKSYDLGSLKALYLAGERLDPDTYHWASAVLGVPVVDHWWQTRDGWPSVPTAWAWSTCR